MNNSFLHFHETFQPLVLKLPAILQLVGGKIKRWKHFFWHLQANRNAHYRNLHIFNIFTTYIHKFIYGNENVFLFFWCNFFQDMFQSCMSLKSSRKNHFLLSSFSFVEVTSSNSLLKSPSSSKKLHPAVHLFLQGCHVTGKHYFSQPFCKNLFRIIGPMFLFQLEHVKQ